MIKILLSLFAVLLSCSTWAHDAEIDGIYYNLDADTKEATVTLKGGYGNSYSGDVVIPSSVTYSDVTYSVTGIGNAAFSSSLGLTSVKIPSSVTTIGNNTFYKCTSLTSIVLPNSVTTIGYSAFYGCNNLASVEMSNNITNINDGAFEGCTGLLSIIIPSGVTIINTSTFKDCESLTSVVIPNSVTKINESAFVGCKGLTSVTIGSNVISIGNSAFLQCSSLASIEIPGSVTSIGAGAFNLCSALTSIEIPANVTSIGDAAFTSCSALTSISVSNDNPVFDSRDNCNAIIETASNKLILGCQNSVIPNSVTSIGMGAFAGYTGLTSIKIPSSVTSIEMGAFYQCTGLTSVTCEATKLPTMGADVFYDVDKSACSLYVPSESVLDYQCADQWKEFGNILPIDPTGFNEVVNEQPTIDKYFDFNGREIPALQKGMNIVKYSDGTTKKLFKP